MDKLFFPVGGTGGGPTERPFRKELWKHLLSNVSTKSPKVALLTTPSRFSNGQVKVDNLIKNHIHLEDELRCKFTMLDEDKLGAGGYDDQFDVLCITCGDSQSARKNWELKKCEDVIHRWYDAGVLITGDSAGFILFYDWASTDSVPGPEHSKFGVMKGMGIINGGAIPHADTQQNRIPDFNQVLSEQYIQPVLALGEDTMAAYVNGEFQYAVSPLENPFAQWVELNSCKTIAIQQL